MADKPKTAPAKAPAPPRPPQRPSQPPQRPPQRPSQPPQRPSQPPQRPSQQLKKPSLAPPPQVFPLKPPPSHHRPVHFRQQPGPPHKRRYRHRRGGGCSGRRVCCLGAGVVLLVLCLALAAACLSYLYFHPHLPSFHLQPVTATRFRVGNSTGAVSAIDATIAVRVVSWNPNDKIAFDYSGGSEGSVAVTDDDGDVPLGWAPVDGFEQAARSAAALGFVASVRGVVVDEAVAARVKERYRRRQLGFKVVVDTHVGARAGKLATGKLPVRLFCEGAMAARVAAGAGGTAGPMSKCHVYLFRVRWFNLS